MEYWPLGFYRRNQRQLELFVGTQRSDWSCMKTLRYSGTTCSAYWYVSILPTLSRDTLKYGQSSRPSPGPEDESAAARIGSLARL